MKCCCGCSGASATALCRYCLWKPPTTVQECSWWSEEWSTLSSQDTQYFIMWLLLFSGSKTLVHRTWERDRTDSAIKPFMNLSAFFAGKYSPPKLWVTDSAFALIFLLSVVVVVTVVVAAVIAVMFHSYAMTSFRSWFYKCLLDH